MSFKEAIELELLTDYKVITIDVKKSEIAEFIKDNNLVQLNDKWKKETEARSMASMLALRKAMKLFPIKNAVSFHSSIEKAIRNKDLQDYITDTYHYSPIDTFTVSGKMPTTKRNIIVKEFADSPKSLITNARCLTEGVDVPNIDCIVFSDPRKSKVDIVQALGRALRKKEGKEWGYVILPVIYDDVTQEIDNENFNEILAIVRCLASNDDRIIEYFKDKKEGTTTNKKERVEQFQFEVFSDYVDANQLANQLQIKLWEKLSKFNWMPFEEAREFVRKLNLKNQSEWLNYTKSGKKPNDIPATPERTYKLDWKNLGDFLGTYRIAERDKIFRSFNEARDFVRTLNLKGQADYQNYSKSGKKPIDIPASPDKTYKTEWKGYGDYLGTGNIAPKDKSYRPFEEARKFIRTLNLNGYSDWLSYAKSNEKPIDIPTTPERTYKSNWKGMGDFLGTGNISNKDKKFRSFNEARDFVRTLNLKSETEWRNYIKSGEKPKDIPANPSENYKEEWKGVGDFLGTKRIADRDKVFRNFNNARDFVRTLNLKSIVEWRDFCKSGKKPEDIPANLERVYKEDWKGFNDFLDNGNISAKYIVFRSFNDAREFVKTLNLKGQSEWKNYCKSGIKPEDIPTNPSTTYKTEWKGFGDFLGTGNISNKDKVFRPFDEAREFVRTLKLKSEIEWRNYCKSGNKPSDIPSNPNSTYKTEWKGVGDFLGKE
jgi:superfamily II DNA/RNA helicase